MWFSLNIEIVTLKLALCFRTILNIYSLKIVVLEKHRQTLLNFKIKLKS